MKRRDTIGEDVRTHSPYEIPQYVTAFSRQYCASVVLTNASLPFSNYHQLKQKLSSVTTKTTLLKLMRISLR